MVVIVCTDCGAVMGCISKETNETKMCLDGCSDYSFCTLAINYDYEEESVNGLCRECATKGKTYA